MLKNVLLIYIIHETLKHSKTVKLFLQNCQNWHFFSLISYNFKILLSTVSVKK